MPDWAIASCSTGTIISVSLCNASRATLLYTNDTTATSRITGTPSQVVLVDLVVGVGFAGRFEPLNRRVVGLQLVGPVRLDPLAHVHVLDRDAADQAEERV